MNRLGKTRGNVRSPATNRHDIRCDNIDKLIADAFREVVWVVLRQQVIKRGRRCVLVGSRGAISLLRLNPG